MNQKTVVSLLQGEPWVEYRTRVDLPGQSETDPQVRAAHMAMLADLKFKALLAGGRGRAQSSLRLLKTI